jgi:hypothetical protein
MSEIMTNSEKRLILGSAKAIVERAMQSGILSRRAEVKEPVNVRWGHYVRPKKRDAFFRGLKGHALKLAKSFEATRPNPDQFDETFQGLVSYKKACRAWCKRRKRSVNNYIAYGKTDMDTKTAFFYGLKGKALRVAKSFEKSRPVWDHYTKDDQGLIQYEKDRSAWAMRRKRAVENVNGGAK